MKCIWKKAPRALESFGVTEQLFFNLKNKVTLFNK
jgi:hypothetical protein